MYTVVRVFLSFQAKAQLHATPRVKKLLFASLFSSPIPMYDVLRKYSYNTVPECKSRKFLLNQVFALKFIAKKLRNAISKYEGIKERGKVFAFFSCFCFASYKILINHRSTRMIVKINEISGHLSKNKFELSPLVTARKPDTRSN